MNSKRDIYFANKIYKDVNITDWEFAKAIGEPSIYIVLADLVSYPVIDPKFQSGEDVTGRYELKHQIRDFTVTNPVWQNVTLETYKSISEALCTKRIVALPLPASTGEGVKEKAVELVEKFYSVTKQSGLVNKTVDLIRRDKAKQCALICVDEILNEVRGISIMERETRKQRIQFWQQVRNHIQTL